MSGPWSATDRPDDRVTLRLADPEHLNPLTA